MKDLCIHDYADSEFNINGLVMFEYIVSGKMMYSFKNRSCEDKIEFAVVVKGRQTYAIEQSEYAVLTGDVFVAHQGEVYSTRDNSQTILELFSFQIDMKSVKENFLGLSPPMSSELYNQILNYKKRVSKVDISQMKLLQRAYNGFYGSSISEKLYGYGLFIAFISQLTKPEENVAKTVSVDIQHSIDYVSEQINYFIPLPKMASVSGLSVSYFKSKFKQQLDMTPREYINYLKIESAKKSLTDSSKSITSIAFELDFASSNYFSMVFKRFTNLTPTQYRKLETKK